MSRFKDLFTELRAANPDLSDDEILDDYQSQLHAVAEMDEEDED